MTKFGNYNCRRPVIIVVARQRKEEPDYYYLKELFRHLRNELNIKVTSYIKKSYLA